MNSSVSQRLYSYPDVFKYEVIKEEFEKTGKLLLKGILQKADTLNQNGRIYPRSILEREVRNYQKFIIENRSTGELDHPDSSVVSLQKVSHVIRDAHMEGDTVMGVVEVLPLLPMGKILEGLIQSEIKVGISSRGVGSTKREGDYQVVQDDFQLITWDIVSEPSTPNAFLFVESKNLGQEDLLDLRQYFTKSDRIDRVLNDILFLKK